MEEDCFGPAMASTWHSQQLEQCAGNAPVAAPGFQLHLAIPEGQVNRKVVIIQ